MKKNPSRKKNILITIVIICGSALVGRVGFCLATKRSFKDDAAVVENDLTKDDINDPAKKKKKMLISMSELLTGLEEWGEKFGENLATNDCHKDMAQNFAQEIQNLVKKIAEEERKIVELNEKIHKWRSLGKKRDEESRELFSELQCALSPQFARIYECSEHSLTFSVKGKVEKIENVWVEAIGNTLKTRVKEICWEEIERLVEEYELQEYWEYYRQSESLARIFASYVLQRHLWNFILNALWLQLPKEQWENILLEKLNEKIKFLRAEKLTLSCLDEDENEIVWPASEILVTRLQQDVYIFLVENAYQDNDFVNQAGKKIKEELNKYRKLKKEHDKDEDYLGKLLVDTWRLFYFSLKIPQWIDDIEGEREWIFVNRDNYDPAIAESKSLGVEEKEFAEKNYFCYFPWIGKNFVGDERQTTIKAKVIEL